MNRVGNILRSSNRNLNAGRHYIVYYSPLNDNNFIGAMLTHLASDKNAPMLNEHFEIHDKNSEPYKVINENSHLVKAKLIKIENWGPFRVVGSLTDSGIEFLTATIGHLDAETWEEYLIRTNN